MFSTNQLIWQILWSFDMVLGNFLLEAGIICGKIFNQRLKSLLSKVVTNIIVFLENSQLEIKKHFLKLAFTYCCTNIYLRTPSVLIKEVL